LEKKLVTKSGLFDFEKKIINANMREASLMMQMNQRNFLQYQFG